MRRSEKDPGNKILLRSILEQCVLSVLCTPYLSKKCKRMFTQSKFTPAQQQNEKNSAKCAFCCVHCAHSICQKKCIRMFTKSIFNPTNQKSAFYLEKQKRLEKQCKMRTLQWC